MRMSKRLRDLISLLLQAVRSLPFYFWAALGLRLILMVITAHNDAIFIPWLSYPIQAGHWDIYTYLDSLRSQLAAGLDVVENWAPNPPLTYYTLTGWMWVTRTLGLFNPAGWDYNSLSWWGLVQLPRALLVTKSIYLLADVGIWLLLRAMVSNGQRRVLDLVWLFNPITLVSIYVMGQTDILSVFWVVLALRLSQRALQNGPIEKRRGMLIVLCLGIGAAYKLWPLILLPLFAFFLGKRIQERLLLLATGVLPLVIVILPFIGSTAFRNWVLFGLSSSFLNQSVGRQIQNTSMFIVAWAVPVIFFYYFTEKFRSFDVLWQAVLFTLVAFFTLTLSWEFYWLTWVTPLLALAVARAPESFLLYVYQSLYFLIYMIRGWDLGAQMFNPITGGGYTRRSNLPRCAA